MADPVSLCNLALAELGSTLIAAFDEGTSVATLCGHLYPEARDAVLELHPFNFALVLATLARSADTPPWKWQYQYPLPTQPFCLRVREVDVPDALWEIGLNAQGHRVLYTDAASVSMAYTARIEDLNLWSPLARQVLVKMLGSMLAKTITGQTSLAELKLKEVGALLPEARRSDGQEGSPRVLRLPESLAAVRTRSTSGVWPYYTTRTP